MFDQTFVDGTQKTKKPYTILLSLCLQVGLIGIAILIPLIYTQTLPNAQLKSMLVAPPPPPKPKGPQRIGGNVMEANLLRKVQPIYPPLAKSARVQGTVEFTATISKEGNIENLQLVRGHPLLVNAAKEAVLQWKYRPTMLNGSPVEVITDIIVNFTLSQ
jgi:TonB family protein